MRGMKLIFPKTVIVAAMIALPGCATTPPSEVRMIPTADHGVGVRFSRGNALMVSNGPSGAIMLLPIRYNDTQKFFFSIAAFNTSGYPSTSVQRTCASIWMGSPTAFRTSIICATPRVRPPSAR